MLIKAEHGELEPGDFQAFLLKINEKCQIELRGCQPPLGVGPLENVALSSGTGPEFYENQYQPPRKTPACGGDVLALALGVASASETINFATGQNAAGNIQFTGDALDAHWTLTSGGNYPLSRPNLYVVVPGQSDSGFPSWINNGPNSSWIAPNPDNAYGNGDYVISYSFDLTGYDLTTAQFTGGEWTIDDEGYIQLNGTTIASLGDGNWGSLLSFNIPTSDLVAGVNTLTITSINSDSYIEGVRLEGTLTVALAPPSITSQPLSQSVFQGGDAVFQVIASGSAPLGYQWWYNQTNILAGQTNATLSLSQATSAMSGSYSVVITNTIGSITSAASRFNGLSFCLLAHIRAGLV